MGYALQDKTKDQALTLGTGTAASNISGNSSTVVDLGTFEPQDFHVVIEVTACSTAAGDTAYAHVEGSDQAGFGGTQYLLATQAMGAGATLNTNINAPAQNRGVGTYVLRCSNQTTAGGAAAQLRYIRIRHKTSGATSSLTYSAYIVKR